MAALEHGVTTPIKSKAGQVLADPTQDAESKSLAAYVLGDREASRVTTPAPTRSREDLERILAKIDGQEGQTERAAFIREQLASYDEG